ncbi:beta-ketoacyl-[acyl-carrier-protein] synthase family protein [Niveibacterium microcysteis]|uniref:Beta-ketoacyl-[acyl-carrier-protein] synthase family protein n=1 Tax=Niveibacterium microcysteis TaxID=2811415 RepID=A0ABX7M260_9RHOO|nr:beta-ketoacyl-[acyl-carrier-protein] synthase family protein [Niveibacterium microcysteis]QSI75846.1 beta-ketoacyl-[acyl-carrier-protein] synthase family protein [Niveibacterium microcysteis]
MSTIYLNHLGLLCALGDSPSEVAAALQAGESPGMRMREGYLAGREVMVGEVRAALPSVAHLPLRQRSRNNALMLAALAQIRPQVDAAIARVGAHRVAVVLGTSTSGIAEGEQAMRERVAQGEFPPAYHYGQQELGSPAQCLAETLGTSGPIYTISTACSSSARALISAARLLRAGLADVVIAGGVDSLCAFTVSGFAALDSVSTERCNPFSRNRHGINIGEGAALFLVSREPAAVSLTGWGESADAHHMSAPDPEGRGAEASMREALRRAGLAPENIDYVNVHGTATPHNDAMEAPAIARVLGTSVPVSSTKPLTGHTLGAAGAIEAALAWLALQPDNVDGWLPPHLWDGEPDPALPALCLATAGTRLGRRPRHVLSNSFAFGGNNASLILGAEP